MSSEIRHLDAEKPFLCFTERADERSYAGVFALVNQYLFAESYSLETYETFLSKVASPSLERLFMLGSTPNDEIGKSVDVREVIHSNRIIDAQNAHEPALMSGLKMRKKIFDARLKIRDEELHKLHLEGSFPNFTLGIHLRGTDKSREIAPPTNKLILNTINNLLKNHPITNIFLATDDHRFVTLIKKHFGHLDLRLGSLGENVGRNAIHLKPGGVEKLQEVDSGALRDVINLSKCQVLLYSYSNLSRFALFLGAERFIHIEPLASDQGTLRARLVRFGAVTKELLEVAKYRLFGRPF